MEQFEIIIDAKSKSLKNAKNLLNQLKIGK